MTDNATHWRLAAIKIEYVPLVIVCQVCIQFSADPPTSNPVPPYPRNILNFNPVRHTPDTFLRFCFAVV